MNLQETIHSIRPLDAAAMEQAARRWDSIAKPLHSLGLLEEAVIRIAGIQRTARVSVSPRALLVFCADNGVVAQGVTQTDQSVTAIVAENFTKGQTSACVMAKKAGVDLIPVDIGVSREMKIPGLLQEKIRMGTGDLTQGARHGTGRSGSGAGNRDPSGKTAGKAGISGDRYWRNGDRKHNDQRGSSSGFAGA